MIQFTQFRLSHKINLSLLFAVGIAALFWFIHYYGKDELQYHAEFVNQLDTLEHKEAQLSQHLLETMLSTYPNYDNINEHINIRQQLYTTLSSSIEPGEEHHSLSAKDLQQLGSAFAEAEAMVRDFQRLHSTVRNSSIYVHRLSERLILVAAENGAHDQAHRIFDIVDRISLSQNLRTAEWLSRLDEDISQLELMLADVPANKPLVSSFLAHAKLLISAFPNYLKIQQNLEHLVRTERKLIAQLRVKLERDGEEELTFLVRLSYAIFFALILAEVLIIYFLILAERAANYDVVTGVGNRRAITERIKSYHAPCLFLINLDQLSHVNSIYGINAGDDLLRQVVARLRFWYRGEAELFRLGSKNFALLFESLDRGHYTQKATDLLTLLEDTAYDLCGIPVRISSAISIADTSPLLEHATIALTDLKTRRHAKFIVYSEELGLEAKTEANLSILKHLKEAIANDRIRPYFQPIVCNRTLKIVKYECLIRLETGNGDVVSPAKFLPIARESGLYAPLSRIMIKKSMSYFRDKTVDFSINLSPDDISNMETMAHIFAALDSEPELARRATFEILESEKVEDWAPIKTFIQWAKGLGSKIAIDDFGAGYSNFETVLSLHIDYIKIDGSLIKSIDTDHNAQMVTRSILAFARDIGVETVVEFVHSEAVLAKVRELGADYSQGYHLGMPEADIITQAQTEPSAMLSAAK